MNSSTQDNRNPLVVATVAPAAEADRALHAGEHVKHDFGTGKLLIAIVVMLGIAFTALCIGRYRGTSPIDAIHVLLSLAFPIPETWDIVSYNVVVNVRLPRVLAAALIGGGLALSGATYQGVFQNPLVAPDILGVSGGACVGAALSILLGLSSVGTQVFALVGGLAAVALTLLIPRILKNNTTLMLVLAGVVVSGFANALIGILKYVADPETQLAAITYWMMGSISNASLERVGSVAPAMIVSIILLISLSWRVNVLSMGEAEAMTLGVNVRRSRTLLVVLSTLLTGCAVCISGLVGWVGLIIPHLTRLIIGTDNTKLMPIAFFLGASFMIVVDTCARTLTGSEIPLSILTGLIGTPLFIWLLYRTKVKLS